MEPSRPTIIRGSPLGRRGGRLRAWAPAPGPAWRAWLHCALSLVWIAALTLWAYEQYLFLNIAPTDTPSLLTASTLLRSAGALWEIAWVPATCVGVAAYMWSQVPRRTGPNPLNDGLRRRVLVQAWSCSCLAICLYVVSFRLLPVILVTGMGTNGASSRLIELTYPPAWLGYGDPTPLFNAFRLAAWLGLGVVALQALLVVRRFGGRASTLGVLLLTSLSLGLGVRAIGYNTRMPIPFPESLRQVTRWAPDERALVLGPDDSVGAARLAETFLATHTPAEAHISDHELDSAHDDTSSEACGLCLLPRSVFLTARGVPLGLAGEPPRSKSPAVLEIPLSGDMVRIGTHGPAVRRVALSGLESTGISEDWVVLKLDADLEAVQVVALLVRLREMGVRRVSLGVVPVGYAELPSEPPTLAFGIPSDVPALTLDRRPSLGKRKVVMIHKYIPADRPEERRCSGSGTREHFAETWPWVVPTPGGVPADVVIEARAGDSYQQWIVRVERAIAGGATTLHVPLP